MKYLQSFRLRDSTVFLSRYGALLIILLYLAVTIISYQSTLDSTDLGFRVSIQEDDVVRVSWVLPGGFAWDEGVRNEMQVTSIDGVPVSDLAEGFTSVEPEAEAILLTSSGNQLSIEATQESISQNPMKSSLWATGAVFTLLGVAVLMRRPDFYVARLFAVTSGLSAVALAIAPSAAGPAPPWSIIVMGFVIIGLGIVWLPLGFALLEKPVGPHRSAKVLVLLLILGFFFSIAYALVLLDNLFIYTILRPTVLVFFSLSLLGTVALLAVGGMRQESTLSKEQARICLWGTAIGILPFVFFTLIPEALGYKEIIPSHINVLALIFVPAFFAYAILQHQMMGIRRLVHRGMVYGISSLILFVIINLVLIMIIAPLTDVDSDNNLYRVLIPVVLVGGIILFSPLRRQIRRVIDRYFYQDAVDYRAALGIVPQYLLMSGNTGEIANMISQRLAHVLSLEAALIFLGQNPLQTKLVATEGEKAGEISRRLQEQIEPYLKDPGLQGIVELRLESDSLLFAHLESSGNYLGYIILGPKQKGEVFLEEEKQLLATLIPIISLVFDKAELSDELRGLSQRLIKAEEKERARIAGDLHDGPLQKAAFLVSAIGTSIEDQRSYANQLVAELREICAHLRPAILGDLGLVPALEWLLDNNAKRSEISAQIMLYNINEEDRFSPDVEDTLFRIAQEAINNIIKHAQAKSIELSLSAKNGDIMLHVTDDGIGFKTASRDKGRYGLPGMRERAIQVGGFFDVHSSPGLGTTVVVSIPIEAG